MWHAIMSIKWHNWMKTKHGVEAKDWWMLPGWCYIANCPIGARERRQLIDICALCSPFYLVSLLSLRGVTSDTLWLRFVIYRRHPGFLPVLVDHTGRWHTRCHRAHLAGPLRAIFYGFFVSLWFCCLLVLVWLLCFSFLAVEWYHIDLHHEPGSLLQHRLHLQ